jgi:hypothetical protein
VAARTVVVVRGDAVRGSAARPAVPVREGPYKNFAGWWYFAITVAHVGFESWLE